MLRSLSQVHRQGIYKVISWWLAAATESTAKMPMFISVELPRLLNHGPMAMNTPSILGDVPGAIVHPILELARPHLEHTRGVGYQRGSPFAVTIDCPGDIVVLMAFPWRVGFADEALPATGRPTFCETVKVEACCLIAFVKVGEPGHCFHKVICSLHLGHL